MTASTVMRQLLVGLPTLLLILLSISPAVGQEEASSDSATGAPANPDSAKPDSEIVVVGKRPDEQANADQLYASMLRQQMYDEVERMREEETIAWRETDLTYKTSEDSRMTFGYDPVEERQLRELTDINEMPGETVKPATLFRAKF